MKKLFYGLGAVATVVTPVVAVVSCGSKASDALKNGLKQEFVAKGTAAPADLTADIKGTVDYDRSALIFEVGSESLNLVLKAAGVTSVTDTALGTSLDAIETALRDALSKMTDVDFQAEAESEKEELKTAQGVNELSVGTYPPKGDTTKDDDHIELGLNGLSANLVLKFFRVVKPTLADKPLAVWNAMLASIK